MTVALICRPYEMGIDPFTNFREGRYLYSDHSVCLFVYFSDSSSHPSRSEVDSPEFRVMK